MLQPVRAAVLASVFLLGIGRAQAATMQIDTSGLQFVGFRAGARLEELDAQLLHLGGRGLRCRRSTIDHRVTECRAALSAPDLGGPVDLWVSAIDSVAGVITISGRVAPEQLERWRRGLQDRYGTVGPKVQGTQWMLQWVRRGRMLRLTWRLERAGKVASVSLVDGRVLDDWGRSRRSVPAMRPTTAQVEPSS